MMRLALLGAAAAAAGLAHAAAPSHLARPPFLAVVQRSGNHPAVLARLDPLTLRPVSRQVVVGEYHDAWSRSPDGSRIALGRGGQGIGVSIADLRTMRLVRQVRTGIAAEALGWLAPRRLVAALQRGGTVLVDPDTGRTVRRWPSFSFPDASAPVRHGLVMLFPRLRKAGIGVPLARVSGTMRLAIVDAPGRLRSVVLERIRLGVRVLRNGFELADRAGLAVDPARGRAYVFAAGAPVAEVDLRSLRVSYHRLPFLFGPRNAPARLRRALWLGQGRVAVVGRDFVSARGEEPVGATVVDTASWSWRTLDRGASSAAYAAGRLVVNGARIGVRAYALDGRRVFSLLERRRVLDVWFAAGRAYVRTPSAVEILDVGSGKVVGRVAPRVELLAPIARAP